MGFTFMNSYSHSYSYIEKEWNESKEKMYIFLPGYLSTSVLFQLVDFGCVAAVVMMSMIVMQFGSL